MSVTKGVVSRIDRVQYVQGGNSKLLAIQVLFFVLLVRFHIPFSTKIDAAINPGNSGGPVLCQNKLIGVAFQVCAVVVFLSYPFSKGLSDADGIGYVIPPVILSHFLSDYKRFGSYQGFCMLGLYVQTLVLRLSFRFYSDEIRKTLL